MSDYILNEKGKENKEAPHKLILQIKGVHMKAILSLHIRMKKLFKTIYMNECIAYMKE